MATHSSTLAWRTPRTEEPGGLWSIGCQLTEVTLNTHTGQPCNSPERSLSPNSNRGSLCSYTSVALSSGGCSGSKPGLVVCILEHQSTRFTVAMLTRGQLSMSEPCMAGTRLLSDAAKRAVLGAQCPRGCPCCSLPLCFPNLCSSLEENSDIKKEMWQCFVIFFFFFFNLTAF